MWQQEQTIWQMFKVSLKYMELNGRNYDLKIASFLFSSKCLFLKLKMHFLQGIMGKI